MVSFPRQKMNNDTLLRMKDVVFCLLAAKTYDLHLGRLELQKIVYLADSMGVYLFILSNKKNHETYKFGPYDKRIQIAIDALAIREFISYRSTRVVKGNIAYKYSITDKGMSWAKEIVEKYESFEIRKKIFCGLLYSLRKRSLISKVKALVYAEPMYVDAQEHGHHYDLNFLNPNSGHSYLAFIEHYLKNTSSLSIDFTIDMYVDYLNIRSEMLSTGISGDDDDFISI